MSFTDYIYVTVQNPKSSLRAGLNAFLTHRRIGKSSILSNHFPIEFRFIEHVSRAAPAPANTYDFITLQITILSRHS